MRLEPRVLIRNVTCRASVKCSESVNGTASRIPERQESYSRGYSTAPENCLDRFLYHHVISFHGQQIALCLFPPLRRAHIYRSIYRSLNMPSLALTDPCMQGPRAGPTSCVLALFVSQTVGLDALACMGNRLLYTKLPHESFG